MLWRNGFPALTNKFFLVGAAGMGLRRKLASLSCSGASIIELAADLHYDGGICEQMGTRPGPDHLLHFFFFLLFFFSYFPLSSLSWNLLWMKEIFHFLFLELFFGVVEALLRISLEQHVFVFVFQAQRHRGSLVSLVLFSHSFQMFLRKA